MDSDPSMPDMIGSAASGTHRVLTAPLIGNVDTVHLFLTLGVVLVSVIVWTRILAHIKG